MIKERAGGGAEKARIKKPCYIILILFCTELWFELFPFFAGKARGKVDGKNLILNPGPFLAYLEGSGK